MKPVHNKFIKGKFYLSVIKSVISCYFMSDHHVISKSIVILRKKKLGNNLKSNQYLKIYKSQTYT